MTGSPAHLPFRRFSSIEQFRHVVADVRHYAEYVGQDANARPRYDDSLPKPTLTFRGTVKLHGSNCGVAVDWATGVMLAQSREQYLSVDEDNFGFCAWFSTGVTQRDLRLLQFAVAQSLPAGVSPKSVRFYGEWCGPAVNGKTAIGQLPMRWVLFGVLLTLSDETEVWMDLDVLAAAWGKGCSAISFITSYPTFEQTIDFNAPEAALDALEALTLSVESRCPVAAALGQEGLGEGIVWTCTEAGFRHLAFKTKGAKHKGTKSARVVSIAPEVLADIETFVDAVLTPSRLEQGYALINADVGMVQLNHLGQFLQWVGQDVLREERDTLIVSGLDRKQVMPALNRKAKTWFMAELAGSGY